MMIFGFFERSRKRGLEIDGFVLGLKFWDKVEKCFYFWLGE